MTIRLMVVDDQSSYRDGLVAVLSRNAQFDVVVQARNGEEACRLAVSHGPEVVLMDLKMPVMDGVTATRRIRAECPRTEVVVLSTFDDEISVLQALRAGAVSYLLKDARMSDIERAIQLAAVGQSFLSARAATLVVERLKSGGPGAGILDGFALTPREREIWLLVGRGNSNKDVARGLELSEGTVKNHLSRLFEKLGVADRLQAALLARECGLV
jgi:DNA-binding NarL/FixJ family response regulator